MLRKNRSVQNRKFAQSKEEKRNPKDESGNDSDWKDPHFRKEGNGRLEI